MKKTKLASLCALFIGIASFIAYSNGAMASENSNDSEDSNECRCRIVEENLFKGLKFIGLKILPDFSIPITEEDGVEEILTRQVGELYDAFNREGVPPISYRIVHEGDKISFVDFKVYDGYGSDDKDK